MSKANELQTALFDALLRDLADDEKCNPALYKVCREVLQDHKAQLDELPKVETSLPALPFRQAVGE